MAAASPIPVYTALQDVFSDADKASQQRTRWNHIIEAFEDRYGRKPTHVIRAPGRVNLMGDHIDYTLFGVFPAAIESDVLMAIAKADTSDPGRVTAENIDSKYTRQTFAPEKGHLHEWTLDIDKTQLRWESYVKAGYYGVLERFYKNENDLPNGIDLLVTGSVPAGSGLSSSAAVVVASTLSFLVVNDKLDGITKGDLVKMTMDNERRVGVNSGGMDQSSSVISHADAALYITFFPSLDAEPIPLPITAPRSVFVCANSLVVSDKVVHARTRYNLRFFEISVAARVLAHQLGVSVGAKERVSMREVVGRWAGENVAEKELEPHLLKKALEELGGKIDGIKLVESDGEDGAEVGVTLEEMIRLSGMTEDDFRDVYMSNVDVEATHFQLYKRAKHVLAEAWRVLEFRDICLRASNVGNTTAPGDDSTLKELGTLMDESHKSCSELCENSCSELDLLVRLAKDAGAYGSRVTGAGWGGCTVSLVEEGRVPEFIDKMRKSYPPYHGLHGEELAEVIFPTKPSSGASVFKLTHGWDTAGA
ncbi:galactokinase gal [Schizopora paradoxa]|uniref:Galactokinase n=1 Tax=Schizopora paradoxa TaxID=27342 RepID=A0A0H2S3A0_9AGAM|nr:galactokinase gal [Schizopora paradoxa]